MAPTLRKTNSSPEKANFCLTFSRIPGIGQNTPVSTPWGKIRNWVVPNPDLEYAPGDQRDGVTTRIARGGGACWSSANNLGSRNCSSRSTWASEVPNTTVRSERDGEKSNGIEI